MLLISVSQKPRYVFIKKKNEHNREMEGFDDLIFSCMLVLTIKDVLLTNTAPGDWNNAQGLFWFCLHQPQRDLDTLERNSSVHPAGMRRFLGPFPRREFTRSSRGRQTAPPAPRGAQGGTRQVTPTPQGCVPSCCGDNGAGFPTG